MCLYPVVTGVGWFWLGVGEAEMVGYCGSKGGVDG